MKNQQGYLLVVAVFFVLVIGVMGNLIAYIFSARAPISAAQYSGYSALYMAESGLEIATRLLSNQTVANRLSCTGLTGEAQTTNASISDGTITMSASGGTPVFASSVLSSSISASATTISVSSSAGFANSGRLVIDREVVSYNGIVGNTFVNVQRAEGYAQASAHPGGASVSQYQCMVNSASGIPSVSAPSYQRALSWNVQLQDVWVAASRQGNSIQHFNWNQLAELAWSSSTIAANNNTRSNLNDISMLSGADGWTVGDEIKNKFSFTHRSGSSWSLINVNGACDDQNLYGVSMVSYSEGWAVGARYIDGCPPGSNILHGRILNIIVGFRYTIMRWNGSAWSLLTPSSAPAIPADGINNQDLNAVHVIDTNNSGVGNIGFAVGNSGVILQYNGSSWSGVSSPTSEDLWGVFVVSASQAWAVGDNGTLLRWNGSTWSSISSPTGRDLKGIAMLDSNGNGSANTGWAVGDRGAMIQYNGSSWGNASSGTNKQLNSVDLYSDSDAWAVGDNGTTIHWNGSSWTSISLGTSSNLNGVSLVAQGIRPNSNWQETFR